MKTPQLDKTQQLLQQLMDSISVEAPETDCYSVREMMITLRCGDKKVRKLLAHAKSLGRLRVVQSFTEGLAGVRQPTRKYRILPPQVKK